MIKQSEKKTLHKLLPIIFIENSGAAQAMLPALEAILGQRSAHSLATGPVMAEPADTEEQRSFTSTIPCLLENMHGQQTAMIRCYYSKPKCDDTLESTNMLTS